MGEKLRILGQNGKIYFSFRLNEENLTYNEILWESEKERKERDKRMRERERKKE